MDLMVEFFRHNTMMNSRLLEACRGLSAALLAAPAPVTYGSRGRTLVHIANSQRGYAARLLDRERPMRLPEEPFPGFDAVADHLARGNAELEDAARREGPDRQVEVTGDDPPGTFRMAVSLFLLQAINHSTEHRSQVATILTQIGIEPPEMDGWTYFFDSGQLVAV